jgi:chromosome segregation ATPase
MAELKNLLAESSRRISLKNREIEDLKALLASHTTTIETLTTKIDRFEKSRDQLNSDKFNNDELRDEIAFLKRKFNSQIDRMNKELLENQILIEQLRNQGSRAQPTQQQNTGMDSHLKMTIEELQRELANKNRIIMDLNNKVHTHATEFVKEAPKVVRVQDPPIKEVHYEKDPYILEQNAKLTKEIEAALEQEQAAKLDL